MMSIFCGHQAHWLLLRDLMHVRCLMELSAVLAAFQEAPCKYLYPVIRVRLLGGCQQPPTGSPILT